MRKHNADNERIKRRYAIHLKEAKGQSEASVDKALAAIDRYEADIKHASFKAFHIEKVKAFKRRLMETPAPISGKPLAAATLHAILSALRVFHVWLAEQPSYRSRITFADAEYFSLTEKDRAVATARREKPTPTLEQILHVIATMPTATEIERRDRALVAFTLLTGARDGALASLKLKHVDLDRHRVVQDAREVRTKASKTIVTSFFPVGEDIKAIVEEWVHYLRSEKLWGDEDPLFPKTRVDIGMARKFEAVGLERAHWSSAAPIRRIFHDAFERAGLPYFNPHAFRRTLARFGQELCTTPEEMKAWSQNLGHDDVLTTLKAYGEVQPDRQADLILRLGRPKASEAEVIARIRRMIGAG